MRSRTHWKKTPLSVRISILLAAEGKRFERDLKEKSGRVILAELNSFPSHVVNKHTGLEDASFSKCTCGHAGRHSSKEILRIGMFRTPEPLIKTSKIFKNKITLL